MEVDGTNPIARVVHFPPPHFTLKLMTSGDAASSNSSVTYFDLLKCNLYIVKEANYRLFVEAAKRNDSGRRAVWLTKVISAI